MSRGGHVVSRKKRTFMGSGYSSSNVEEHVRGSHRRHVVRSTDSGKKLGILRRWDSPYEDGVLRFYPVHTNLHTSVSNGYIPSVILSD